MHITSVARLRLDTTHSTTDWNEQNRRMYNNSWLMTLPFDVDDTDCHMPPFQRSDLSSKHLKKITKMITLFSIIIHHSHRCFHYYIYMSLPSFPHMFLIPCHLRIFPAYSSPPAWRLQNTGQWHENMAFGTPLLHHSSFGQKTSAQLP